MKHREREMRELRGTRGIAYHYGYTCVTQRKTQCRRMVRQGKGWVSRINKCGVRNEELKTVPRYHALTTPVSLRSTLWRPRMAGARPTKSNCYNGPPLPRSRGASRYPFTSQALAATAILRRPRMAGRRAPGQK